MNHKAHIILGEVIAKYGVQLAVSNAYCEVYLTGHMVDYPDERQQLVAIKVLELPKALLNLSNSLISEADLYKFIQFNLPCSGTDSVAWGVDAWAAALNISETTRKNIRKQCYPSTPQRLNSGLQPIPALEKTTAGNLETIRSTSKPQTTSKGLLLTSAAGIAGLVAFTVFGQPLFGSLGDIEAATPETEEASKEISHTSLDDGIDIITTRLTSNSSLASHSVSSTNTPTAHFHHEDLISNNSSDNQQVTLTVALLDESVANEAVQHEPKLPVLKYNPKMEALNASIEAFLISDN